MFLKLNSHQMRPGQIAVRLFQLAYCRCSRFVSACSDCTDDRYPSLRNQGEKARRGNSRVLRWDFNKHSTKHVTSSKANEKKKKKKKKSRTVTINFIVQSDCMWMQVFNWELSGRLREGRRQMESRGAAASEGWRGLRDLCGGQSHLISCLPLHLTHCCSHKRIAQLWSSAWIVTLPFRPSCSLKWSRFNSKSHKKRRNGRKPGCVIQFLNFNIPTKHLATRTPISI